jgi:hypothetical protein
MLTWALYRRLFRRLDIMEERLARRQGVLHELELEGDADHRHVPAEQLAYLRIQ